MITIFKLSQKNDVGILLKCAKNAIDILFDRKERILQSHYRENVFSFDKTRSNTNYKSDTTIWPVISY